MGKPGPKRKPTAAQRIAGNPSKRALNEHEPQPPAGAPEKPDHLGALAGKTWDWLCDQLDRSRLLVQCDVAIMTMYCETWADYVINRNNLNKVGLVLISQKTGQPYMSAYFLIDATLKGQLKWMIAELGLSASSRPGIHVPDAPADTEGKERFFNVVGA